MTGIPWEMLPPGDGLWKRHDLVAALEILAREGAEALAPGVAGSAWGERTRVIGLRRLGIRPQCRPLGGEAIGPNPTDRRKSGTKRHRVVESSGIPLAVTLSAANVHDIPMLEATLDAIEPIRRPRRLAQKESQGAACR
jgi:hypothetical protein